MRIRHILLAEDNPADVYLIREALSPHISAGVEVTVVTDGEQAIQYLQKEARYSTAAVPDLVVLDLNLPKNDGTEVLRYIRENPLTAGIPVVILTSSDSPRDQLLASNLGASCFLTKPSDLDSFLELGGKLFSYLPSQSCASAANPSKAL